MRGGEIKGLRWCDVDMMGRALAVKRSKTEAGERVIPLNADAWEVILALYRQAQTLGGYEPPRYLFPAIKPDLKSKAQGKETKGKIDPTRPLKTWWTAWRRLTRAIQCPECGLLQDPANTCSGCKADTKDVKSPFHGYRFHDLRHKPLRNWPSPRRAIKPSWESPVTCQRRCFNTTRTFAWRRSGAHWTCFPCSRFRG